MIIDIKNKMFFITLPHFYLTFSLRYASPLAYRLPAVPTAPRLGTRIGIWPLAPMRANASDAL